MDNIFGTICLIGVLIVLCFLMYTDHLNNVNYETSAKETLILKMNHEKEMKLLEIRLLEAKNQELSMVQSLVDKEGNVYSRK